MLKKWIAIMAAAVAALGMTGVLADSAAPEITSETIFTLAGAIVDITDEGLLLDCGERGEYLALVQENTVFAGVESLEALAAGMFVTVTYNGQETRSLPPQVSAERIACFAMTGVVTDITDEGFLLERRDEQDARVDDVLVRVNDLETPELGARVTVYFNGVMTLSLPGQINAQSIAFPKK